MVAIVAGLAFLGEHISPNEPLGGLVVLVGVAFGQCRARGIAGFLGRRLRRAPELAPD